ncbi:MULTISPECIES: hypothetical protein [unclassified Gordonia (in: high G+C Gram-positive bacteria)]|uniref:hypothetical protein n=1 Tax=unclassified Gordonia (in: high G+C Gram-positive bacteria) TaxID=2657482 RepID=UPI0011190888|nr:MULTISPECIES: hypothetical protein [unclassified Gordonia (in: high G+C Gram-positive bacteria)]MDF3282223.1 hypothetical protein [Gordonia sp. N1V]
MSSDSEQVLLALNGDPQEVSPGVTVALAWLDSGQGDTYVVATLHNQSTSSYNLNQNRAYFSVGNERTAASDVLPHAPLDPGFEGKVAWQFPGEEGDFSDAILTIEGVRWTGDFTKLTQSGSARPSK